MQTEKRNVLIVVIAAVVIIGVAIGLFFLISFVNDRNYKKEHWFESDATIITIQNDHTKEGKQEVKLKDYANYGRNNIIVIEFHKTDSKSINAVDVLVSITNDDVVIRETAETPFLSTKDLIRKESSGPKRVKNEVYDVIVYKLYKQADDDSLNYVKTIEVRFYGYVWGNP